MAIGSFSLSGLRECLTTGFSFRSNDLSTFASRRSFTQPTDAWPEAVAMMTKRMFQPVNPRARETVDARTTIVKAWGK